MKNLSVSILLITLISCNSADSGNNEKEIEAIKSAIQKETDSFYKVDKPTWDASWVQGAHAYWSYSDSTGTSYIEGWENINKNFESYFKTQVANRNIDVDKGENELNIDRTWQEFRIYGEGAYVRYTQKVKDAQIDRDETSQIRIMEKADGVWRVAYIGIVAKYD